MFFPSWVGCVTSTVFLGLTTLTFWHEFPHYMVSLMLFQYVSSTAIWWQVSFPGLLQHIDPFFVVNVDRCTAVVNVAVFIRFYVIHHYILLSDACMSLVFTVAFKAIDALSQPRAFTSVWYVFWHLNLFANNMLIICYHTVLPMHVMMMQHIVAIGIAFVCQISK